MAPEGPADLPVRRASHHLDVRVPEPPRGPGEILREIVLVIPNLVILLARLLRDPRVGIQRKLVAGAALAYAASPIDLIPDVIPVLGQADDAVFIAFAIHHLLEGVPKEVRFEYWQGSEDALDLVQAFITWGAEMVPARLRRRLAR